MNKIPLIIIAGPTAVGKTDLSIEIAKHLHTDIISADSMQIYNHMDIGTAKITKEEMQEIKHYLIDEVDPSFEFSVAEFQERAKKYIKEIYSRGKIPILAGGTGLYINSLLYEMDFTNTISNQNLREKLQKEANEYGIDYIHDKLKKLDPESADRIHPNNVKRVIRALEVCMESKDKMGDFKKDLKRNEDYHPIMIILNRDRNHLYDRINQRVDIMIKLGLIQEVKKLMSMGYDENMTSMKGIGYKEIIKYLKGEYSLEEAIYTIKRDSRRYAKRQVTWFKRYSMAKWFDLDKYGSLEEIKLAILSFIEGNLKSL